MRNHVHLPDILAAADAAELMTHFGEHAQSEAAARADRSRRLGNLIHYCRWRQIERMIAALGEGNAEETLH